MFLTRYETTFSLAFNGGVKTGL